MSEINCLCVVCSAYSENPRRASALQIPVGLPSLAFVVSSVPDRRCRWGSHAWVINNVACSIPGLWPRKKAVLLPLRLAHCSV